jgi:FlaA1/EpsC-like NDP-sugar epimerase
VDTLLVKYRKLIIVSIHVFIVVAAFFFSFASRLDFGFINTPAFFNIFLSTLVPLVIIRMSFYRLYDLFRGLWRYTGLKDLGDIIKASFLGTLMFAVYVFFVQEGKGFPKSIFIIDFAYNILFLGGVRMAVRIYRESIIKTSAEPKDHSKKVIIIGAGKAGEMLLREMKSNPSLGFNPIGFVDDDRSKLGQTIHGVRVLGNTRGICKLAEIHSIEEAIIAMPSAKGSKIRRIFNTCKRAGVRFKTVPFIGDIIDGKVKISQIRDVAIEDLLGRDTANLDMSLVGKELTDKVIMVTGAAGSIGSEIVRQASRFKPKMIVMFERAENDLYHFELELSKQEWGTKFISFVGDVTDRERVKSCLEMYRPAYIFHAAAYKHVPMMELNPSEAVKNNIFGTRTMADLAVEFNVDKFVLISTDKAVRPTNVMGATKRIAELILQEKSATQSSTHFVAVRFGNVLGSNGSVIPLFKQQIEQGGPITVTHPDITRYFMTIPEAVQLVIQAGAMGQGGEIFVLEMGSPVRIKDLAENLIRLSGLTPGKDIAITYTGLRPGEKLFEELLIEGEGVKKTHHNKIWVLESPVAKLDALCPTLSRLQSMLKEGAMQEIKLMLKELVPEYKAAKVMVLGDAARRR